MANRKTTFLLRRSNVIDKIPDLTGLTIGELAVNTADAKLYTLYTNGNVSATEVRQIGWDRLSIISGGTVSGNTIFTSGVTGNSFNIFSTPVNNNTNSQILTRNSTTGNVEYRDVSSISGGISGDYLPLSGGTVTGGTIFTSGITANTLQFDTTFTGTVAVGQIAWDSTFGTLQQGLVGGNVIQKIGETSFALVKNAESTTLNKGEVVYIFGATGDKISVKRASNTGDTTSSKTLGVVAENIAATQNGLVITKGTLDGLNLGAYSAGTILWLSSTPGQFTDVKQYAPYHLVFIGVVQRANAGNGQLYVSPQNGYELDELHNVVATGATYGDLLSFSSDGTNDLWVSTKKLTGDYTVNGNLTVTGTTSGNTFYGSGIGLTNIPISGVTNLQSSLDLKTNLSLFNSHTGNTNNPHQTSFNQLTSTAHTHTISDITNLQTSLDNKFDKSGGTVSGSVVVTGNVTILGTATTINTDTLTVKDNIITLNSNYSAGTPFFGSSGIEILRGSATTSTILWDESNLKWYAGLTGNTKQILLSGDSLSLLSSGHTHPISEITNLQTSLDNKFDKTGGTISGGLTATTISATTYQNLPTDIRVTGGTYNNSSGIITFTNNTGGTFTVTGLTTGTTLGTYLTGASYSNNVITFTTNSGTTSTVTINTMTGLTINGALSATTISANTITSKIYENIGGLRAVPLATSNTAIASNSYDYYMNIRIPHSITASTVLCMYSTLGSDATRVAIYRGRDTTATLVGQGFKAGATLTTISEYTLTATTGQTLSFSGGEWIVIAVAVGGFTTVNRSATTYASTDLSWANATDSAAGGFPTNPRTKSFTLTSFPCFEIF